MDPESRKAIGEILDKGNDQTAKSGRDEWERYRESLLHTTNPVSPREILNWIRTLFDQTGQLPPDDSELSLLMERLRFTTDPITTTTSLAWAIFQDQHHDIEPLELDDYPVLEAMAQWYFEQASDATRDQRAMIVRSLAIYEYLVQNLQTHGAKSHDNLLADLGLIIVAEYVIIEDFARARFYVQLLENEYFAGRLGEEEYLELMRLSERILIGEGKAVTSIEKQLHKINQLCWDTISKRDRELEARADAIAKLREEVARAQGNPDIGKAEAALKDQYGKVWGALHQDTRRHLTIAQAFIDSLAAPQVAELIPSSVCFAVKNELRTRLLKPRGFLEPEVLNSLCKGNPIAFLIQGAGPGRHRLSTTDQQLFHKACLRLFGRLKLAPEHVDGLILVLGARNHAQHPEGTIPYGVREVENFVRKVWASGWLTEFLTELRG